MVQEGYRRGRKRRATVINGVTVEEVIVRERELRVYDEKNRRAWLLDRPVAWSDPMLLPGGSSQVARLHLEHELYEHLARESAEASETDYVMAGDTPMWLGVGLTVVVIVVVTVLLSGPALLVRLLG